MKKIGFQDQDGVFSINVRQYLLADNISIVSWFLDSICVSLLLEIKVECGDEESEQDYDAYTVQITPDAEDAVADDEVTDAI